MVESTCDKCFRHAKTESMTVEFAGKKFRANLCRSCRIKCINCESVICKCPPKSCACGQLLKGLQYCETCLKLSPLLSYTTRINNPVRREGTEPLLGVELELWAVDRISTARAILKAVEPVEYIIKHDGSIKSDSGLAGVGLEIVSSPMSLRYQKEFWPKVLRAARLAGGKVNSSCGVHVHHEKLGIEKSAIYRLMRFLEAKESYPWLWLFAKRYSDYGPYSRSWAPRVRDILNSNGTHMDPINLSRKRTIEIRIFRSTLNEEEVISNCEFTIGMIDIAKAGTVSGKKVVDYILSNKNRFPEAYSYLRKGGF